ncbi:MAG: UDP-N-acetylglucosamine--N-acetylmuramyl-(pentapeptide) pyrophosphoryl-undecaprenol N-acetylglucosamine transferase, partial [Muribaculaceae bacterium]|nr:UDP-N-acetylglucosamine--N-acetylmuramyl-(pentapeptide) pyrophosphoryl-undecaprenol N-acetylglucosamine transferase [Muribaculaceae bacterium]
ESIARNLELLTKDGTQLFWQTGKNYNDTTILAKASAMQGVTATTFISDMDVAYRAADLVVSRAGAGSISELQALGKATILVPSPNVAEDHQRKNALALVNHDAAIMIEDSECLERLAGEVNALIADPDRRQKLSDNISAMALTDSDEKIVDNIIEIISTSAS